MKDVRIGDGAPALWPSAADGRTLAISPDGRRTLAISPDGTTVCLLDLTRLTPGVARLKPLGTRGDSVRGIAFDPDGHTPWPALAPAIRSGYGTWCAESLPGPRSSTCPERVIGLAYNRRGTLLATIGLDDVVRLWNTHPWQLHAALTGPSAGPGEIDWFL
ncbi:WD40 repeat domain-containing protein [Streptomyces sp. NPDC002643]